VATVVIVAARAFATAKAQRYLGNNDANEKNIEEARRARSHRAPLSLQESIQAKSGKSKQQGRKPGFEPGTDRR
jgi:hypothetical protein